MNIINTQKVLYEIKNTLLKDADISRMLYYDTPDALKREIPDSELLENYIFLCPVMESAIEDYERNVFIMINLTGISLGDTGNKNNFEIIVIADVKQWELEDNKIRTLEICDRIIKKINNKKFSAAGKIEVDDVRIFIVKKQLYGYVIDFSCVDSGKGVDF